MPTIHVLHEAVLFKTMIAPIDLTVANTPVESAYADTMGYENLEAVFEIGVIGAPANESLLCQLYESALGGNDAGALVPYATTGAILAAGDRSTYLIHLNLSERLRYIKAHIVPGAGDGGLIAVEFALSGGRNLPPTQEQTPINIITYSGTTIPS